MWPHRVRLRVMAAAVGLVFLHTFGCSWISVSRPPPGPLEATPRVECQPSTAAPVADTIGAVLAIAAAGALIGGTSALQCRPGDIICSKDTSGYVSGAGLAVSGLALAFSAGHGYSATAECRELKEAQVSCITGVEEACRRLQERKPK